MLQILKNIKMNWKNLEFYKKVIFNLLSYLLIFVYL